MPQIDSTYEKEWCEDYKETELRNVTDQYLTRP